jgi:hypothetical protein
MRCLGVLFIYDSQIHRPMQAPAAAERSFEPTHGEVRKRPKAHGSRYTGKERMVFRRVPCTLRRAQVVGTFPWVGNKIQTKALEPTHGRATGNFSATCEEATALTKGPFEQ